MEAAEAIENRNRLMSFYLFMISFVIALVLTQLPKVFMPKSFTFSIRK